MNNLYRILHKPSGLYYKPSAGYSHLGEKGKIYTTAANGVDECKDKVHICLRKGSKAYKKFTVDLNYVAKRGDSYKAWFEIPKDEFEKEPLNIIEK